MKRAPAWVLACALANAAQAEDAAAPVRASFEPAFFRDGRRNRPPDLARFEHGTPTAPGVRSVDVRRDGRLLGRHAVRFAGHACIDAALVETLGLAVSRWTRVQRESLGDPSQCLALELLVPGATVAYDPGELALEVSIPQAALVSRAGDAIDATHYDAGIPAFRLAYALTAVRRDAAIDDTQATALHDAGLNAGPWRVRHRGTHAWRDGGSVSARTIAGTVERDVPAMEAQVVLGDFHTRGVLFDAVGLRGVRMQSDERMWPPSRRSPTPVVRGIAATHARVQVRQGEVLLLDTTVPPGPFAFDDLRPVALGGALEVRVAEADGHVTHFAVPHAALPNTLRRGRARFSVAAGRWRERGRVRGDVVEATWEAGVSDRVTTRAGAQLAHGYAHASGGVAFSTRVGAWSFDLGGSRRAEALRVHAGARIRIGYAGYVARSGTTVDVAAWRHGSAGFRALHDALRASAPAHGRERGRFDFALRQDLRAAGALSFGYVERRYAAPTTLRQRSAQLGWGRALGHGGAWLQATFEREHALLALTMPLRVGEATHSLHASTRVAGADTGMQIGASGTGGRDGRLAWGVGALHSQASGRSAATTSGSVAFHGNAARIAAGAARSPWAQQWSATLEGGVLWHANGLTFAPILGDTIALLQAPHGAGARALHDAKLRLDRDGEAIVPHLSPYRRNRVGVDPRGADPATHFAWTEGDLVPRAGAVVALALPTTHAPARWWRLVRADGSPVPFAADVHAPDGTSIGRVGRDGLTWVRVDSDAGHVDVRWLDDGETFACRIAVDPHAADAADTAVREIPCEPGSTQ